jgi:cyclophilin family peptidyl-prolyl cis-trans isomerase
MATDQTAVDFSGLEDVFEWFKVRKNLLIGVVLVVLLVFAGWTFVTQQRRAAEMRPWHALFAATEPWSTPPDELASLAASADVKGSPAEPFALYWEALRRFEAKETAAAVQKLNGVLTSFPKSALCTLDLCDPEKPTSSTPVVSRMIAQMQRLEQWGKTYPVPTANPPPKPKNAVSLVTDRGTIVLALYNDIAPLSCELFERTALLLKDRFIARASPDQWIELGQKDDGTNIEAPEGTTAFPPYEDNKLSHFSGCVSFRQTPFSKAPYFVDLHIDLKTDFNQDGRSTVFAQVVEGLELLTAIAKDEHKTEAANALKTPIKITDVTIRPVEGK